MTALSGGLTALETLQSVQKTLTGLLKLVTWGSLPAFALNSPNDNARDTGPSAHTAASTSE